METVSSIADYFEHLVGHTHFSALVLGCIISISTTQFLKFPVRRFYYLKRLTTEKLTPELEAACHTWTVRAIALFIGAGSIYIMWPEEELMAHKLVWSLAGGSVSPMLYSAVAHYFPWLGEKTSADKAIPP